MNKLSLAIQTQIISLLTEGNSLRATSLITDVSINTIAKLLVDVGKACQVYHNEMVKGVTSKRIQCAEIWSFVYAKDKNAPAALKAEGQVGDVWTWVGIDTDSKLVLYWFLGDHSADSAIPFIQDLASRLANNVELTIDGHKPHLVAVEGTSTQIDYALIHKIYGKCGGKSEPIYSSAQCVGAEKIPVQGTPDDKLISTSFIEPQNMTSRKHTRRFTPLTNGFLKKIENHCYAIALHYMYYNFVKIHKTLHCTPAMEAGLTSKLWEISDLMQLKINLENL